MSDVEFIQLGGEVLNEMQYIDAWSKESTNLRNKMIKLKIHMLNNPNNKFVQDFIEELINRYISLFFNQELMDALCISQPFYKQIQVYRNLPSTTHPSYGVYLFDLLLLSDFPHFYSGFLEALQKYRPDLVTHSHIQKLLAFVEQSQNIMRGSKDDYGTLEEEKRLYQKAYRGEYFPELETFAFINNIMGQDEARYPYMCKKEGNIGELYAFDLISNKYFKMLVAKEAKNGFGYDIYFYDNHHVENLVEVKTTLKDIEAEDSFFLSENEYRVMQECENNPLATYIVCRVKLDSSLNLVSITFLTMLDSTTFVDFVSGTQYQKENKEGTITFKKVKEKVKIYTQPEKEC